MPLARPLPMQEKIRKKEIDIHLYPEWDLNALGKEATEMQ
jgi:hypothetical protein